MTTPQEQAINNAAEVHTTANTKVVRRKKTESGTAVQVVSPKVESNMVDSLLRLAVENNFDLDKLQQLLEMKKEHDKTQARREFDTALVKFQEECPRILKNKDGWDKKYRYAELGAIEAAIKQTKAKNGFSHKYKYAQAPGPVPFEKEIWLYVTCVLSHIGGHSEETTLCGPPDNSVNRDGKATKNPIQSNGSTVTYLERYTLKGVLGLSTIQEDTDGVNKDTKEEANKTTPTEQQYKQMIQSVKDGKRTVKSFIDKCNLSDEQVLDLTSYVPQPQK